jgi:putative nucleotidyltransferase with HDIG domain
MLPGANIAAFSAFGNVGNVQIIAARSTLSEEALTHFQSKLSSWMRSRGGEIDMGTRNEVIYPLGTSVQPLSVGQLASILSAPVTVGGLKGLVLSVAFEVSPDAATRKQLERFLEVVQHTVELSGSNKLLRVSRQKAAEKLLEPDFQKYPELMEHSRKTSDLADQFAHYLGLTPSECETMRIGGLLHDVGMRLLDYNRLYRKPNITPEEMKIFREHPVVGAAIVEPVFGPEMAYIVLSHHERADGRGYPNGIAGENIPLAARVIQICEAFDAMTSPHSYQAQMSEEAAVNQVLRMGGAEFDHALATKFSEMLRSHHH